MGVLAGIRVVEMAGIGPVPFCGMMLADHGAEVIRVDRLDGDAIPMPVLDRSRRSICIDVKRPEGSEIVKQLVRRSDALIEGFRPGVMERVGLGPDELLAAHPGLVYGRMTGWGQDGPLAQSAGHDINYIALTGALHTCGRAGQPPTPPANYLGDFGGGGMLLAFGMVSALLAVARGGQGQVVDCAMTDGSALLMGMTWSLYGNRQWQDARGVNLLDTGAPFYDVYPTRDGQWLAVGAIEPAFFAALCEGLGLAGHDATARQFDPKTWPAMRGAFAAAVSAEPAAHWREKFEGSDGCATVVESLSSAPQHPHNRTRGTYCDVGGMIHPSPAPRFGATPTGPPHGAPAPGRDTDAVLSQLGYAGSDIAAMRDAGVIR